MAYPGIEGKVAIVTGAAGGIGKALVDGFVREGLRVAALDIDEKGVRALQEKHGKQRSSASESTFQTLRTAAGKSQPSPSGSERRTFSSTTPHSA